MGHGFNVANCQLLPGRVSTQQISRKNCLRKRHRLIHQLIASQEVDRAPELRTAPDIPGPRGAMAPAKFGKARGNPQEIGGL